MAAQGVPVTLWLRDEKVAAEIATEHENKRYMPGFTLDPRLQVSTDMAASVASAEMIFLAIPSSAFRSVLREIGPHWRARM